MADHIALLGDSIFDNSSYTNGLPDVVTHLRGLLPAGSTASLLAVDGSTTADLRDQLDGITPNMTRVVASIRMATDKLLQPLLALLMLAEGSGRAVSIEPSSSSTRFSVGFGQA